MKELKGFKYQSYWPAEEKVRLLHQSHGLRIGVQAANTIEPGACLLVWVTDSLDKIIQVAPLLPDLPRPLYCKIPGPEAEVREIATVLEGLGFELGEFNLDMRLEPIPQLDMPSGVAHGLDQDFAALASVEAAVFTRYLQSEQDLSDKANSDDSMVLSTTVDGVPVGLLTGNLYGENNSNLFMRSLVVLPQYRGRGLARKLVQAFLFLGRQRGAVRSMLWLGDMYNNLTARKLYESFGYRGRDVEADLLLK